MTDGRRGLRRAPCRKGRSVNTNGAEKRIPLELLDIGNGKAAGDGEREPELRRRERDLKTLATELAQSLEHLERALLASKGAGFSGRVQDLFDETQALQREAAREFGRKVGDRLGRESLWQVQKGVEVD